MSFHWGYVYLALSAAVAALALACFPSDRSPFFVALILFASCLLSNFQFFYASPHMSYYPVMDMTIGSIFAVAWYALRQSWLLVLTALLLADSAVHAWYFSLAGSDFMLRYQYDLTLNVLFLAQLGTVAYAGIRRIKWS